MEVGVVRGTVYSWSTDVGWGVLVSPELPGEVFAHFMHIQGQSGVRSLEPGASVVFEYRKPGQDGFDFAANWVRETDQDGDWATDG
jgi:CspA family cold shock protein